MNLNDVDISNSGPLYFPGKYKYLQSGDRASPTWSVQRGSIKAFQEVIKYVSYI